MSYASEDLAKATREYIEKSLGTVHDEAARIADLEADNERLKCCGNCCWYSSSLGDCNDDVDDELDECNPSDGCHFTPPRWSFDHVDRHARAEMMPARGPDFGDGVWERRQDNPPGMGLINDVVPPDRVEDGGE